MTDEPKHPNQPDFSSRFFELELRDLNDGKSATVRDPNAHYCTRCTKRIPEDDRSALSISSFEIRRSRRAGSANFARGNVRLIGLPAKPAGGLDTRS
jgi:hypothetical protein